MSSWVVCGCVYTLWWEYICASVKPSLKCEEGYYCHVAGSLAAPVLLLRLQATPFYLRERSAKPRSANFPSASNFHSSGCDSWELELGFPAHVHHNKGFFEREEPTNSQAGRQGCVCGRSWRSVSLRCTSVFNQNISFALVQLCTMLTRSWVALTL